MVLHSVYKGETPPPPSPPPPMASTFSPKSQHIHYFPLSNVKWLTNHSDAHPLGRHDPTNLSPSGTRRDEVVRSPELPSSSSSIVKNENRFVKLSYSAEKSSGSGNSDRDDPVATEHLLQKEENLASRKPIENLEKKVVSTVHIVEKKDEKLNGSEGKSKIFIRIPARSKTTADVTDTVDETECAVEDEEPVAKTWNLRPRRSATKPPYKNGDTTENGVAPLEEIKSQGQIRPELTAPEENPGRKKLKFSATLLKKEIEKDFLLLTGSKPSRRPKKRAKIVQKQLDYLSPGLRVTYVTPDLYEVRDGRHKG